MNRLNLIILLLLWIPLYSYTQNIDKNLLIDKLIQNKQHQDSVIRFADEYILQQDSLINQLVAFNKLKDERIVVMKKQMNNVLTSLSIAEANNKVLLEEYENKNKHISRLEGDVKKLEGKNTSQRKWLKVTGIYTGVTFPFLVYITYQVVKNAIN